MKMIESIIYRVSTLEREVNGSGLNISTIRNQLSELVSIVGDIAEALRKTTEEE